MDPETDTPAADAEPTLESIEGLLSTPIEKEAAPEAATPEAEAAAEETPGDETTVEDVAVAESDEKPADEAGPVENEPADTAPETAPPATPTKTEPVAPPAAVDDAQKNYDERLAKYKTDRAALKAKIDSNAFDPFDDGKESTRLALEGQELADIRVELIEQQHAKQQRASAYDTFFAEQAQQEGLTKAALQQAWETTLAQANKEFGQATPEQRAAATAVATERYKGQIAALKAGRTPKPVVPAPLPKGKTPITKGGAMATPAGVPVGRSTVPKTLEPEDELMSSPKGFKNFLD